MTSTAESAFVPGPVPACWRLRVRGIVQGVGFRPFVYRLAKDLHLAGWVRNTAAGAEIEIEGPAAVLASFRERLLAEAPSLARIVEEERTTSTPHGRVDFTIRSGTSGVASTGIPPDLATCARCLHEVFDPSDRRYHYPFANCTECGPRFTIVRTLPYERRATTMAEFSLCPLCAEEYRDPADRRFHAESMACPACGPQVWLEGEHGSVSGCAAGDDIARAATLLRHGAVLAIQGLGGFHLACDATNDNAVQRVRLVKDRLHKPLAVMVATVQEAHAYGELSAMETELLTSVHAPIVLVRQRLGLLLASAIAPGTIYVGLMLPHTPLHHVLLRNVGRPLVMTSGNRRGEPLCCTHAEAKAALSGRVDAFLLHNRPIQQRCDDSVMLVTEYGSQSVRRSRGYAPVAVPTPIMAPSPILAVGAALKNTFCLFHQREAVLSQHIGDTENLATQQHFTAALAHLQGLCKIAPTVVAHDLHPDYATSRYAASTGLPLIGVQHHHAHIAACLADNGVTGPVIGVALDGTGYGIDGAIWGGEFLIADLCDFRRVTHFEYLPLPGGDAAIRRPDRVAFAYLASLLRTVPSLSFIDMIPRVEQRVILRMLERKVQTPMTSSCGRLFDAIAALVGLRTEVTYEGQAAIELEALASGEAHDGVLYPFTIEGGQVRLGPLLGAIVSDLQQSVPARIIGRRFHHTLAEIVLTVCVQVRDTAGLTAVALSGGCWQNRLLLSETMRRLITAGFVVYLHQQTPANDGGISLGQAVVAAARLARD